MIIEEIRDIKSDKIALRKFGTTFCLFFAFIAVFLYIKDKSYYLLFVVFSLIFLLITLVRPNLLKPIHKIWMTLAVLIGWFMTRVILLALFYLVVTPIGISAKIFRKKFLNLEFNKDEDSYWILRPVNEPRIDSYSKQY